MDTISLKRFNLSTIIIVFVCFVVLVSLLMTNLLITEKTSDNIEHQLEEKALIVSKTVAESPVVRDGLQDPAREPDIQTYARNVQEATGVLFIVVMDMNGIRKSHPNEQLIGQPFVGGDESRVLQGEEYISRSEGTLGKSLRSFVPIVGEEQRQIGAVSVGISLENVEAAVEQSRQYILVGLLIGLLFGIAGAVWLARFIKKSLFGLEPYAIARIHEERNRMLHSVHEGVIAIDKDAKIVLVNKSAREVLEKAGMMEKEPIGRGINDLLPGLKLEQVLKDNRTELDDELDLNGVSIIANRVPLVVNDEVIGAIATFRDKTEVNRLAEQLTGVQMYAETLRAQSHEYMNQLHVLLGMIQLKEYGQVKRFIARLVDHQVHEVGAVTRLVKDPVFAGFLIGKISYARESHIELIVRCETEIPEPKDPAVTHELITIVGNVIDNAIENLLTCQEKRVTADFSYVDELLSITIVDSGTGIPESLQEVVFEKGISSKDGMHRGFGLYLAKTSVDKLEGSIELESESGKGTAFTILVPYEAGGVRDD